MNVLPERPARLLSSIFHPTDFSPESRVAFAHALKLALSARAELRIMHVDPDGAGSDWQDFPRVRATLAQWGVLPAGSAKDDVAKVGLRVDKMLAYRENPANSILHHLEEKPADLMVLATHQRDGLARLFSKSIAEPVARRAGIMTLFIPAGIEGFVALQNGAVTLRNILIPVDRIPHPQPAVEATEAMLRALGGEKASVHLLHVGADEGLPDVQVPTNAAWTWETTICAGNIVEEILRVASEDAANLIVMATQGHHDFLDTLLGSITERVLRGAHCPILAIPAI
jgi:nucleotide-binding universal stress UspA family protein